MDTRVNLIEKIETPLLFAAWNSYSRLSLVKNLRETVITLLKQLETILTKNDGNHPSIEAARGQTVALETLFQGFDAGTSDEKIEIIQSAISALAAMKIALQQVISGESARKKEEPATRGRAALSGSIKFLPGVGPRLAGLFARKDIFTVEDILYFLPRRYEDRRHISLIMETIPGVKQIVVGRVVHSAMHDYGKRKIFEVSVEDSSGMIKAKWFKGQEAFLRKAFPNDARVILAGVATGFPFDREMIHPEFEILSENEDQLLHFKRIVPVYSETAGLPQKTIRRIAWKTVQSFAPLMTSPVPEEICRARSLMDFEEAVRMVHFPGNDQKIDLYQQAASEAHRRLIYDEFFFFQLGMALRKKGQLLERGISFRVTPEIVNRFSQTLSFTLTAAQRRTLSEIHKDMASPMPMNRLLQGDVGSGKTVVAAAASFLACANGYQAAIMAPTEILAEQHFRNISKMSSQLGIPCELLTGNLSTLQKTGVIKRIETGQAGIIIGTHALIQGKVSFNRLGLVVIDEQHRFGVVQRASLRKKGDMPDVLIMTATPIPRTLAMTVYGDLDVSLIDEMPPGKIPPATKVYAESQRARVYAFIRREALKGNQAFIVYPLVETSEALDLKDAVRMAEHLGRDVFPDFSVGLVHGRMKGREKEQVMKDFVEKRVQILVATTVIEVGIDIPSASLIVVEHAERFGLSQLHQLRGRVGRGGEASYCILLAQKPLSGDARKRLRIMEETSDGFRIAEEDLAIRGPGEFMGARQSGLPDFRIANIARDGRILAEAKEDAFSIVNEDPDLTEGKHQALKETLIHRWEGRLDIAKTG